MNAVRTALPSSSIAMMVGCLGALVVEAADDLLGLGGAELQRASLFDHLVVLLGDQVLELPITTHRDRVPGNHRRA